MRQLLAATAIALSATAIAAVPASAAVEVGVNAQGPVVEIQVMQQVLGDPDKAIISAGVTSRAQTAVAAMQQNATAMDKVLKRLDTLGIPRDRVQTSGITLNPQYEYPNNRTPQFAGYDASNTVTIELRDLDRVGPVLDWLVAEGATNINGPSWSVVDDEPRRAQARKAAFDKAALQARDYALMAGYKDFRLLAIEEALGYTQQYFERGPMPVATQTSKQDSTPTRPGQVATQVTITAKFELLR
ncbi:DUF541 domain-containing protein [Croceicoccus ponticola]|uniref:DUF541 domain-containing protein n=1 Tax=Croceicoccus ponticola TaxID=2217664 RepID=A0A437GVG3_9SPHN|nr:SIMPL domain-containing protein [Croceicoccus ponticola]RVQ65751.1 DUF541 domain-containing protein [Croceicoccus ponticola]